MRRSWLVSAVVLAVTSVACTTLLGDYTSGAGAGDGGPGGGDGDPCGATQKTCNGACVSREDPSLGCGGEACTPCAATINAAAACKAGACSFACNEGFSDCDGNPATGCETRTANDLANCGKCGDACGAANSETAARCEASKCVFTCKKGFSHCGPTNGSGCDTELATDPANCGACGHSCLGGKCTGGKCEPFQLASASRPSGLALDAMHVYFTFPSVPLIQRVQRNGKCTPAAPCPQDFAGTAVGDPLIKVRGPSAIVSDGASVWWTNQAVGNLGRRAAALPPGPITNFGPAQSTQPGYLALAGGKVYWTSGFANAEPTPHVRRANLDGTNVETVATYANPATTFAGKGGIAADAANIYWASENSGVFHAGLGDAPCVENSTCKKYGSAFAAYGVAVDATFVYWTEPANGTVKRAPKAGGQSFTIAVNQDSPQAIAVLGTHVYWGNTGAVPNLGGTIRRAPQVAAVCDGVACEQVAVATAPDAIVAGDDGIYWTDNIVAGGVYRLAK